MIETIETPDLKKISNIQHAFFTRQGGVSSGSHASLNCAYASQDNPDNVKENRRRAMNYLGHPLEALCTVKNVHGNKVVVVENPWLESAKPEADAMVTRQTHVILGSDSADCPIILFADEHAGVIGLAHAGWRGAKAGIIETTVAKMVLLGAEANAISAAMGPCIAQNSYEVSSEFQKAFLDQNASNTDYFKPSHKLNHFLFDLPGYVKNCLMKLNLKSISTIDTDTYTDENRFFSYRRATHQGVDSGGHLSCIYLK